MPRFAVQSAPYPNPPRPPSQVESLKQREVQLDGGFAMPLKYFQVDPPAPAVMGRPEIASHRPVVQLHAWPLVQLHVLTHWPLRHTSAVQAMPSVHEFALLAGLEHVLAVQMSSVHGFPSAQSLLLTQPTGGL